MFQVDDFITSIDRGLRTLTGTAKAARPTPGADTDPIEMSADANAHAAGLMRVNHTGEVCAQALYEGQALTARSDTARESLLAAAREEQDHLVWCRERLGELDARPSVLDPFFYAASFALGAAAGLAGDKISLGFVEATEDQVVKHLDQHMESLPEEDSRSRAIIEQMREDEARHGEAAIAQGGAEFPQPVKQAMSLVSKVMTETTYRV